MVRVAEHLLEEEAGLVQIAGPRQALDIPERAHAKGAFAAAKSIGSRELGMVAVDQGIVNELGFDGLQVLKPARIGGADEFDQRHEEA